MKKQLSALASFVFLCTGLQAQNYNAGPVHLNGPVYDASAANGTILLANSRIEIGTGGVWMFNDAKLFTPRTGTTQTEVIHFSGNAGYGRSTGYVDGYVVAETGGSSFAMPIGHSSHMPLMVNMAIAPGNSITAAWSDDKPLQSTHISGVQYYFLAGYYDIQSANAGLDVTPSVPLAATGATHMLGTADGTNFVDLGPAGFSTVLPAGNYQLRFANSSIALPITLAEFTATRQGNGSQLYWKLSAEQGIKEYAVERSSNGRNFGIVGLMPSLGQTTQQRTYTLFDPSPVKGANYYRLKISGTDGKTGYSAVRLLNFDGVLRLSIYPNPVQDAIAITGLEAGMQVTLLNLQGQPLMRKKATGNSLELNLKNLPAAVYGVQVQNEKGELLGSYPIVKE